MLLSGLIQTVRIILFCLFTSSFSVSLKSEIKFFGRKFLPALLSEIDEKLAVDTVIIYSTSRKVV